MSDGEVLATARYVILATALVALYAPGAALADDGKGGGPAEVAHQFLRAFEKKDWATVRSLFAPNAVVSTVNLVRDGQPTVAYLTAEEWSVQAEKELAPVTAITLELIDTSVLSFDQGATVSVRFRAAGKVGEESSFSNNGIDTYSMTQVGGNWRILRYGTFELLEFR